MEIKDQQEIDYLKKESKFRNRNRLPPLGICKLLLLNERGQFSKGSLTKSKILSACL